MLPVMARGREAVVVARPDPAVVTGAWLGIFSVLIDARLRLPRLARTFGCAG